ncbi:nicotinamide mononucleotide transporter [Hymenobacter daecheongensis DSM 21074]|uniref:Nicotinamide riboside transporter PnuC n=1 Tax=Hymenobacter daecheongensis DSM 21074 TaxID=1121955 RepID=A0A1M6D0P4_9BACT|nr:nicotinamide riboside transporter PnuC [Hymenobacter daecheongensis]SHI66837.1 nicotinamide mononucleotide transporter [Hymenobacter daecheongensis DSM 21074]
MLHSLYEFWTSAAGGTPLEWVAVITGFACVWLAARESLWNFPTAIVSCGLYVVVYNGAKLYADRNLQVVFIAMSLYGWYEWLYGGSRHAALVVTRTRPWEWVSIGLGVLLFTGGFGYYLRQNTDAALPFWDSFTTAGSLAAQYLLTRKRLENWLLWIMVDIIYVPILWYKQLYPTSGLYAVYLALAVYGYVEWRRTARATAATPVPAA